MTAPRRRSRPFSRIFYGWRVVAAGFIVNATSNGIYGSAATIFYLPLTRELAVSRGAIALVFSLARALGTVIGPLSGYLVDRWGPRRMVVGGALLVGAGYLVLSQIGSYAWLLVAYVGIIALGHNLGFMHSVMAVVNSWFVQRRAMAMAVVGTAFGVGGSVLAPLLGLAVEAWGWRWAAVMAGAMVTALVLPASVFLHASPESVGLSPDGDRPTPDPSRTSPSRPRATDVDFTARQAYRTVAFWVLLVATTMRLAVNTTVSLHFIPMMVWKGASPQEAAFLLGALGALNIPLRLILGLLGDVWSKSAVMSTTLMVGAGSMVYLSMGGGGWELWLFLLLYALPDATGTMNWAIIGDFYGRRSFATIRGAMSFFYGWGGVVLPVIAGTLYDRSGSYDTTLFIMAGLWAFGAVVFAFLRRPDAAPATLASSPPGRG